MRKPIRPCNAFSPTRSADGLLAAASVLRILAVREFARRSRPVCRSCAGACYCAPCLCTSKNAPHARGVAAADGRLGHARQIGHRANQGGALINALGHALVSKTGCEAMFLYADAYSDMREIFLFRPYGQSNELRAGRCDGAWASDERRCVAVRMHGADARVCRGVATRLDAR